MIFRKEEHRPERQQTFEEVKPRLEYPLKREMKRKRILEWLETLTARGQTQNISRTAPLRRWCPKRKKIRKMNNRSSSGTQHRLESSRSEIG